MCTNCVSVFALHVPCAELLRENKRLLDKSIRELDREINAQKNSEKKLIAEIKKMAKQNQMGAVKVMAKDLVRTRHSMTKFYNLRSQLQGVSLRIQTLKSTQSMATAMKGCTKAMTKMNKQLNMPAITQIMREFEKQNERMEMTQEAMGDAIDDAFEGDDEEEETEELVSQVLDEIGVDLSSGLISAPHQRMGAEQHVQEEEERVAMAQPMQAAAGGEASTGSGTGKAGGGVGGAPTAGAGGASDIDSDLQARLDNLRKM